MVMQANLPESGSYIIPGVAEEIPVAAVTDLTVGSQVSAALTEPTEVDWYRFVIVGGQPLVLTLQGSMAYALKSYLRLIEKGSAHAHSPMPDFLAGLDTTTYTFAVDEDNEIFVAISSADPAVLPSAGYTISLALAPSA